MQGNAILSKRKPVIGILSLRYQGKILPEYKGTGHYIEEIQKAGGCPIQLPFVPEFPEDMIPLWLTLCDGFLLPGGGDLSPSLYGQEPFPELQDEGFGAPIAVQQAMLHLVRLAADARKPILGICLGMQIINVAFGGTLYQDIPMQLPKAQCHREKAENETERAYISHSVQTVPGSLLHSLCGRLIDVNSFHHQAVQKSAAGLNITAIASDGVIEGIESENGLILGVQWHPENLSHAGREEAQALFRWLVNCCKDPQNEVSSKNLLC